MLYLAADELWQVDLGGGPSERVNAPLSAGHSIANFVLNTDGTRVVYLTHGEGSPGLSFEMFSAWVDGGATVRLNPLDEWIYAPSLHATQSHVFFTGPKDRAEDELFVVPIDGGPVRMLNGPLAGGVFDFKVTPDENRVVFRAQAYSTDRTELLVVDVDPDPDGDGFLSLCDTCPDVADPPQEDADGDGFGDFCDCRGQLPTVYPGAPEINDGMDNQCPGFDGPWLIDETSDESGFFDPLDRDAYSWPAQIGATSYEVARSDSPEFPAGCVTAIVDVPRWIDPFVPGPDRVAYYLNRALTPNTGSWGASSDALERTACP